MNANEGSDSHHRPNQDAADTSRGNANDIDCDRRVVYDKPSLGVGITGAMARESWGFDTNNSSTGSHAGWLPFGLPIKPNLNSGAAKCSPAQQGLSVRRVLDSHLVLVTDLINRTISTTPATRNLTNRTHDVLDREDVLGETFAFRAGSQFNDRRQETTVSILTALDEEGVNVHMPVHAGRHFLADAGVEPVTSLGSKKIIPFSTTRSTSAGFDNASAITGISPKCAPTRRRVDGDNPNGSLLDSRREEEGCNNVPCTQEVLNDVAFVMPSSSSTSSEEVFPFTKEKPLFPRTVPRRAKPQQQQDQQRRGVFGLFGAVERRYFEAFADLLKHNQMVLESFLARILYSNKDLYPKEVDIMNFLRNPHKAPDEQFFMDPLISWPVHLLYAVSCFYATTKLRGYHETFEAIRQQGGLLSSGKGLLAAVAVAMSPTEEDLVYHASKMYRASFFVGLVYSKLEKQIEMHRGNCLHRSCSLLVVNLSTATLQLLLDDVNKLNSETKESESWCGYKNLSHVIPLSKLEMTRIISSRAAIVSGHPLDLDRLCTLLVCFTDTTGVKVCMEYLPITVPENNPFYNQYQHLDLLQMWKDNNIELDASALQLTLYSPVDGVPWKSSGTFSLTDRVALALTSSLQDLTFSFQHMHKGDLLLDFSTSVPCMSQLIAWTRGGITVLSEPVDCASMNILPTPRKTSENAFLCTIFSKCARINTILQSMQWEGKPHQAHVLYLTMSFVDLGLLVNIEEFSNGSRGPLLGSNDSVPGSSSSQGKNLPNPSTTRCPQCCATLTDVPLTFCGDASMNLQDNEFLCNTGDECAVTATKPFNYVAFPNKKKSLALNVYQESPMILYYEMQSKNSLTQGAVKFTQRLSHCTGIAFPLHTLLMCPTVLTLLELWDTYEFLRKEMPVDGK